MAVLKFDDSGVRPVWIVNRKKHSKYEKACHAVYLDEMDRISKYTQESRERRKIFSLKKAKEFFIGHRYDKFQSGIISDTTFYCVLDVSKNIPDMPELVSRISQHDIKRKFEPQTYPVLRQMYNLLIDLELVPNFNPAPKLKRRKRPLFVPTLDQVIKLHESCDPQQKVFVHLCAQCGLRIGEALALTFDDVFSDRIIVSKHVTRRGLVEGLKTSTEREIEIDDALHFKIKDLNYDSGYLIQMRAGRHYSRAYYAELMKKLYLPIDQHLTSHSLRHFKASSMLREGFSTIDVQKTLGHADVLVTLRRYGHLIDKPAFQKSKF